MDKEGEYNRGEHNTNELPPQPLIGWFSAANNCMIEWLAGCKGIRMMKHTAPRLWHVMGSPLGPIYLARSEQGLVRVDFGVSQEVFLKGLPDAVQDDEALLSAEQQIREYFDRSRTSFELDLDLSALTLFQRMVFHIVEAIPAGEVWTYGRVASAVGRPKAYRAVGAANARNPLPLIIPCHRVIGSDGKLHGYGAGDGITTKRWLLEFEGALFE
jgi:methylated-DNA-[protein]-cysteine S-methyltransferase